MTINPLAENKKQQILSADLPIHLNIHDIKIDITTHDVYPPGNLASFFIELLSEMGSWDKKTVLDLGTGSGILSIFLAQRGAHVTAVDIVENCVSCAQENAKNNGVSDKIDFICGDGLSRIPKDKKFDLVIIVFPQDSSEIRDPLDHAFYDDGFRGFDQIASGVGSYLRNNSSQILVAYMDHLVAERPLEHIFGSGFQVAFVKRHKDINVFSVSKK